MSESTKGSETEVKTESETQTAVATDKKSGCKSSVGIGAAVILTILGAAVVFKKKENQ